VLGRRSLIGHAGVGFGLTGPAFAVPAKKPDIQNAIAETSRGRVRGTINQGIRTFKGIPYGAPTDGPNRFLEAKLAVPWQGIRDAIAYGPMCPQQVRGAEYLDAGFTRPPQASGHGVVSPRRFLIRIR
jgi:para-nitrobenzyl esterase